ncbi:unnamed protein product [Cyprideis torosa]|uniref:Uncharacterized protein n=1 Tax=Cyprideis torosa TaxID=163714 RepID=A0A7R8WX70_9CRUS|nr:unnamed protein product [Cyprideis torosa]CAG0907730.1 unnamed protein product [Cyprideis torosa]
MISGAKFETLKKTTAGIREYFNVMLASQLLYKPERDQYDKLTQGQDKPKLASEVYGAVHLVRLFTKLGHCLVYTSLDESQVAARQAEFADVLKFISKKAAHYFRTEDYVAASKDDKALVTV